MLATVKPRIIFAVALLHMLACLFTTAQPASEVFPGKDNLFEIRTVITESIFGAEDEWNEQKTVSQQASNVGAAARKKLAATLGVTEDLLRIDSVALQRFADTDYWFFVVNLSQKTHEIAETLPVLVKLNGIPIPVETVHKKNK
jgi:hypothetical protein